ncbi:MAG: hypothetical protein ABMA00_19490, partial [Gemmatimonas sp.]
PQNLLAAHVTVPPEAIGKRRASLPPALAALVMRCLEKRPADRPQSAADVVHALDDITTPSGGMVPDGIMPHGIAPTAPGTAPVVSRPVAARIHASARRRWIAVVGGVATVAIAGTTMLLRRSASDTPYEEGADVIAVMPLGVTGDSSLARLGRDLVVTVSANLDGVGLIRAVDAMSVVLKTRELPTPIPLDAARAAARDLGARSVLHGSLVAEGRSVRADLVLQPVDGGSPLARLQVTAPVDSIRSLTDSITSQLLRQVWRTGKAPSPLLSEVTTASNEALRAFLAGEAHSNRMSVLPGLAEYTRATNADSSFAQAYLRIRQLRGLAGLPADTRVNARLALLRDRLPVRDQDRLRIGALRLTPSQFLDSGRALAARYPDSPDAQYLVADAIIHSAAAFGVPTREAIPYLDRLETLVPASADVALHRSWAYWRMGDTEELGRGIERLQELTKGGAFAGWAAGAHAALDARSGKVALSPAAIDSYMRDFTAPLASSSRFFWASSWMSLPFVTAAVSDSVLAANGRYFVSAGLQNHVANARGQLAIARGDIREGLRLLATLEPIATVPMAVRLGAARSAAIAAWMGLVPPSVADSTLRRTRSAFGTLDSASARQLAWIEGLGGIAASDSMRVAKAMATLSDTSAQSRRLARSLSSLWRVHRTGDVDSLLALEDETMRTGEIIPATLPVHRTAIGQSLIRSGQASRAERYLMWMDALISGIEGSSVIVPFGPYNAYQRGLALEASGDRAGAARMFAFFVETVDRPPESVKSQLADAKARLERLTGDSPRR